MVLGPRRASGEFRDVHSNITCAHALGRTLLAFRHKLLIYLSSPSDSGHVLGEILLDTTRLGLIPFAHVCRSHPQSRLAAGHLAARKLREAGKTKNRTLANLSDWPGERIEQLRAVLRGETLLPAAEAVQIVRALPHGHVLAALTTARRIDLDALLPRRAPQRRRELAYALIIARLLDPAAKLATARMLDPATASHSLGEALDLGRVTAREIYATLDWLGTEQSFIEATLARRHLSNGALLLYDVTSTYLEGRCCPLARHGYSRDSRSDRPQLVIGLMCAAKAARWRSRCLRATPPIRRR